MTRLRLTAATVGSLLLAPAAAAVPAAGPDELVTITASISFNSVAVAPLVYRAEDVVVGPGPELTADDLVSGEPALRCGDVVVDID
ncbi:MAG: hypothetical protein H5T83_03430, partial [Actinotalea sp.]|nr:hypothetical protein [Actinotalea sp.]